MQGIVFDQLRSFALSQGVSVWPDLLARAQLTKQTYLVTENYPDEELEALISAFVEVMSRPRSDVLMDFGRFLSSGLLVIYGVLLDKRWGLREVLLNTERTIHRVVRLRDPQADPPRLRILDGPDTGQVTIMYDSPRRMCSLGKGIIEGLAKEYGTDVSITDVRCMHAGDAVCEIRVQLQGPDGPLSAML